MMTTTAGQLVAEAKGQIQNLTPAQVAEEIRNGARVIDIREPEDAMAKGRIPGAVPAPRGRLEFYADPSTPYHRAEFEPGKRIILACAAGGRSALGAATLQKMGYTNIAHLDGGLNAWVAQGLPVDSATAYY